MKILLLDNYDSFTNNIVDYFQALGAEVLVFQNNCITSEQLKLLDATHIVLGPGPGRPEQAGNMMSIIDALLGTIPMLGICLGHQAIALAYGAAVVHSPRPTHGIPCWIKHRQRGLFDRLPSPLRVGRYHSLCLGSVPQMLTLEAWTEDDIPMAFQHQNAAVWGLQFHPESVLSQHGHRMLRQFLNLSLTEPS